MNTPEVLAAIPGLTYRQLDHWLNRGFIKARNPHPGSGNSRSLTPGEVKVLKAMLPLVQAGIAPDKAAPIARKLVRSGKATLPNGLTLTL